MERWSGRVAVVTGAAGGIGSALAADLVRAGLRVVGLDRREDKLQALAARLNLDAGDDGRARGELLTARCDLSSPTDVQRAFRWIDEEVGAVSVLVNNAAVAITHRVQDMSNEDMIAIVNTNLLGYASCCREVINSMKRHGTTDGHIVNINSVLGHIVPVFPDPTINVTMYASTKHAVTALCQGLRCELKNMHDQGFRVKVTSVSPGPVLTDLLSGDLRAALPTEEAGKLLKPEDVSRTVCFALACPPEVEMVELTVQATGQLI